MQGASIQFFSSGMKRMLPAVHTVAMSVLRQPREQSISSTSSEMMRLNIWMMPLPTSWSEKKLSRGVPLNTETPGSVIDRLSILALRMYHFEEQLQRADVDEEHCQIVQQKLDICTRQHWELARSLRELLADILAGRKRHRTYRQLKMYNDSTLNPYLYRNRSDAP